MNLHFLSLVVATVTSTVSAYSSLEPSPMDVARDFQNTVNQAAARQDTMALRAMFDDGFLYESCVKKSGHFQDYINALFRYKGTGKVLSARADKRFVIYQVQYTTLPHTTHLNEVMIRRNYYGYKFNRAQEMIC